MKITNVRTVQPIADDSPDDWRTTLGQILVAVDTDCGLTGYGVGGGGVSGMHVVRTVLRDLLLDCDPEPIQKIWDMMYGSTLAFGRKGIAIMAISGVDLALWDLQGKAAGQPVATLLGGTTGKPMPTYSTVWNDITPDQAQLHSAFKLHVEHRTDGDPVSAVVSAVEHARSILGASKPLMLDAWMKWDIPTTLAVADAIRDLNIDWIEEPIPADDLKGYEQLVAECPIPIAGGEHEFTAAAFAELIERRLHHILQPDVCWCGGMTELIKIYNMANKAGLRVCPHRGSEIWSLHALAALDQQPLAESGRPWMSWVGGQPAIENGEITLADAPGLGVTIEEDSLPGCIT